MLFKFTPFSNLLLATSALAVSSSQLGDRHSQSLGQVESRASNEQSDFWAGSVVSKNNGSFDAVTGTFTVPIPSGGSDSGFTISLGIDGFTCLNHFQAGIEGKFADGVFSYSAWSQWLPEYLSKDISGITINGGDVITVSILAPFTNFGVVVIDNQTTGQFVRTYIGPSGNPLCLRDVHWIVAVVFQGSGSVATLPLTNFNNVTITNAIAAGPATSDTSPLSATTIFDIVQNQKSLTLVSVGQDTLLVKHLSG